MKVKGNVAPTGPAIIFWIAAVLCLFGLADATYLTVAHFTGQAAVCGGSSGCMTVLNSAYAKIGPVPIALLGALAYYAAFSCAIFTVFGRPRAERLLRILIWLMLASTLWFLVVQAVLLKSYCRFCLLSAAITFLLAGLMVATPSRNSA